MLMKALRFRTFLIVFFALAAAFLLASFATPDARGQQNTVPELPVSQESAQLELVIAGPEVVPLPRKHWRPLFTAVLINHSKEPVVFAPPRNDWYGERRLEWQAVDSKGRWLDRQPNYAIECDVHGVMRAVPDLPAPLLDTQAPKQIRDADLIVLQPGEKYELKSLADPWFSLNFRRHGVYTLSLHFSLASEHYALSKNSPYPEALKNSSHIEVSSNELTLTIN
jgi:hypothetical protein